MQLPPDVFPDLDALKRKLRNKLDYRVRVLDRQAPVTVMAIHGGYIDAGSSDLATALAGRDYNLFDFQGLRAEGSFELHVTSTRFRDPQLTRLLDGSDVAVSVHCMGDADPKYIWLGGLNGKLKRMVQEALESEGFPVNADSPGFRGEHPGNVVNLAKAHGVQLELPRNLMTTMYDGKLFSAGSDRPKRTVVFRRFVRAVRRAIRQYVTA